MLLASMPIIMRLFLGLMLGRPLDLNLMVQSLSISTFTLGILAIAYFFSSIQRFEFGLFAWLHMISFFVVVASIQMLVIGDIILPDKLNIEGLIKGISVLFIVAIVNFFLISVLTAQEADSERQIDDEAYVSGLKWLIIPLLVSLAITVLTWLLSGYEGTVVNHATIFGVYLAVALVLKDKISHFQTGRGSTQQ